VLPPRATSSAFFARLRPLFTDQEILHLTLCVAVFLALGRSLSVLGVESISPARLISDRVKITV